MRCGLFGFLRIDPGVDLGSSHSQIRAKMTISLSYLARALSIFSMFVAMDASELLPSRGMLDAGNGGQTGMLRKLTFWLLLPSGPLKMLHKRLALLFSSPKLDMATQHINTEQLHGNGGETQPPSSMPAALVAEKC
jgi:hypothetical protein